MITPVKFDEYAPQVIQQLQGDGAFLTVKSGDKLNTMTIGWGTIGYIWRLPVFTVLVRHNRYTYELIEKADNFTVSVPLGNLKSQLAFCGSKSGRDTDKFSACNLTPQPAQMTATPVIAECALHYECSIIYSPSMAQAALHPAVLNSCYQQQPPLHTIYYGKILACYLNG